MKHKRHRRLLEAGKSLLIILLACSALYLTARTRLGRGLFERQGESLGVQGEAPSVAQADLARPVRMAATLAAGEESARFGVQYDTQACDDLFQYTARPLVEALSCAQPPRPVGRQAWQRALDAAPGIYYDLLGEIPLEVLAGWLGAEGAQLEGTARRLILAAGGDGVQLYYQGEGGCYVCGVPLVTQGQLEEALSGLGANRARFAFESEQYAQLDPDTLILPQAPELPVCTAANPLEGQGEGSGLLGSQLLALAFSADTNQIYTTSGTQVIRNGNDTLRLDEGGNMVYHALAGESSRYRLPDGLFEQVEECRVLAQGTVGSLCGDARLYLQEVRQEGQARVVEFGYVLGGAQVQLGSEGYAAQFVIEAGQITQFALCYRTYQSTQTAALVLPEAQAAAALGAMGLSGQELILAYADSGGDHVTPAWFTAGGGRI